MKTPDELRELASRWGDIEQSERDEQWAALGPEQQGQFKAILDETTEAPTGKKQRRGCLWAALGTVAVIGLLLVVIGILLPDVPETPAQPVQEEELAVGTPAPQLIIDHINAFMEDGFSVDTVHTAPSLELVEGLRQVRGPAQFVAGLVQGPGVENHVGVWIILGTLEQPGITLSVNDVAKTRSVAPDASTTDAQVRMSDPPAMDLRNYVESRKQSEPEEPAAAIEPSAGFSAFMGRLDEGASCRELFEIRNATDPKSEDKNRMNIELSYIQCHSISDVRMDPSATDNEDPALKFTVREYRMYRGVVDSPMSVSEDQVMKALSEEYGVSLDEVEKIVDRVMETLSRRKWFGRPEAEIRHASDWDG